MNLYLLTQHVNRGYDIYDSAVVAAESMRDAKTIHPREYKELDESERIDFDLDSEYYTDPYFGWTVPHNIIACQIGVAGPSIKQGVICASYNAG